ncbi:NUDIX domain-containing protein [Mucilaginibacter mallensis]|uniref:NUDIX domain-containing protein n=1 Tax=Mucilaginibacter mallensis TaxID=652787 RepID=A0A1H1ZGJ4_MUCMA|nr:NUDIX domain-containing protein [Mucilaginibacter mallensis]SDT32326.1 NUDIX domain-containing protein [Mucilaginibacter mallensis]
MSIAEKILSRSQKLWETCIPHLSVDNVVFGFNNGKLNVLLLQIIGDTRWVLPGGYVKKEENVNDAVKRVLKERANVDDVFLHQFSTFGDVNRSERFFEGYPDYLWHKQRFISTSYYALVDHTKVVPVADEFSAACEWKPVDALPELVMDHREIVDKALQVLQEQLSYKPIGYNLLPEEFTLTELQNLYESILGTQLNRGNFYRRIMKFDILIKLPKTRKGGAHKSPDLYKFDVAKYEASLKNFTW